MSRKPRLVTAKAALAEIESPLDASSFFNGLAIGGVMEKRKYLSTTGSGEEKYYWVIKDEWLQFGANKGTLHEFRTDPVFQPSAVSALLVASCEALLAYATAVHEAQNEQQRSSEVEATARDA